MKKILPMLVACLMFGAASRAQGAQQAPPGSGENQIPSMQQDSQRGSMASSANKGDRTISGCIRSNSGKYTLESKHLKTIWLTGSEDFAPYVGHTVTLHGNFFPSTGTSSRQGSDFQVKQIDMVADRCTQSHKAIKGDQGSQK
jgi:hypothetical protein